MDINQLVEEKNGLKHLFTAGPASLISENILGLEPCFGRGDSGYLALEDEVLSLLRQISGHENIVRFQSSGSGALEMMISNFANGNVLVVDTGYYSHRAYEMAKTAMTSYGYISDIDVVPWESLGEVNQNYDWVIACYTETSIGLKLDISELSDLKSRVGAKLMLDATASIGLEDGHEVADTISYSSCKGLFGLTGAGFIAFNSIPINEISSFSLNIKNHLNKMMTGPYHAICSLHRVLRRYEKFKVAVINTKKEFCEKFRGDLVFCEKHQPLLCTQVNIRIGAKSDKSILYQPRTLSQNSSVVCHLGEVHLGENATGEINKELYKVV